MYQNNYTCTKFIPKSIITRDDIMLRKEGTQKNYKIIFLKFEQIQTEL